MKRILTKMLSLLLIVTSIFMCSCANIETSRIARLNPYENIIYLEVAGFNTCPLTPEGAFPKWSNNLEVKLNPEIEFPKDGKHIFTAGTDFRTQYHKVESGTIVVDMEDAKVNVDVKYTKTYHFNRVNGEFPIPKGHLH